MVGLILQYFFEQLSEIQTSKFFFDCRDSEFRQLSKLSGLLYVGIQIDINT